MFRLIVVGFLASVYGFYQLPWLPQTMFEWLGAFLVAALAGAAFCRRKARHNRPCHQGVQRLNALIIGLILGLFWPFLLTEVRSPLPSELLFAPIEVTGEITGLTEVRVLDADSGFKRATFRMAIHRAQRPDQSGVHFDQAWWHSPPEVEVHWYGPKQVPRSGETWSMWVKLKPAWGSRNPGAFDYEAWLLQQGLSARGYVRKEGTPQRLNDTVTWRAQLAEFLTPVLSQTAFEPIYRGLIYGDRSGLTEADWALLRETGTVHLMAISGLHIGLIAAIGYALMGWLWSVMVRVRPYAVWAYVPRPLFSAWGALILAALYAMLAGWALPTQRAWLMLGAGLLFLFLRRRFQPVSVLFLAAFLVVAVAPSSILSQGFWLSFAAVGLIFALLRHPGVKDAPRWQQLLLVQAVLTIGLMPLLAVFYQQWMPVSFVANLVAVPFVTLVGLPLLALVTVLSGVWETGAGLLLQLSDGLWQRLWQFLQWLAQGESTLPTASWSLWQALAMYALVYAVWVFYQRWRASERRWASGLSVLGLVAIIGWPQSLERPAWGEVTLTVLDVGQAQALVFETANEVVVYDTGAQWGPSLDGTKLAIAPYLRWRERENVDLLLVSHADQDHMGGTARLLQAWPVARAFSGQPDRLNRRMKQPGAFSACDSDQAWWFSGVHFEVLAPGPDLPAPVNDNDASCVLRVATASQSVLVTGDVGKQMEAALIRQSPKKLDSELLIAGHHGSDTSTSKAFLQAVSPQTVVFSSGFANRYHFPAQAVRQRVIDSGANWRNTACEGALRFHLRPEGMRAEPGWREQSKRWYHNACDDYPSMEPYDPP
ncbi:DNA internalization-related competence protein ComEC/Rec2 [Thiomicrospira sp. WB1]|uniref:DNA internalization-related competence protein ComEC/Rec2 n=1 Tax=Thiomicrospira sp. WB1 TaxID=1685380 RepID=UPI000748DAEB|nr:DNA internalization-related competence protein ComEC/Rec2 [Thiomicrospira sp. WB1]KUJ72844.1 hypothetical protein AVO41_03440 [Thiomicrospira sp. WB1]